MYVDLHVHVLYVGDVHVLYVGDVHVLYVGDVHVGVTSLLNSFFKRQLNERSLRFLHYSMP